jgi:hypothetical protein
MVARKITSIPRQRAVLMQVQHSLQLKMQPLPLMVFTVDSLSDTKDLKGILDIQP